MRKIALALLTVGALGMAATASSPTHGATLIRDAEIERLILDMSEPVVRAAGLDIQDVGFALVNESTINAFATGDNHIFFNTGLMMAAEEYPTLLAVIAHETAHLAGGHVIRRTEQFTKNQGPATVLSALAILAVATTTGNASAAIGTAAATQQIATRTFLQYTRSEEASADSHGVDYLVASGVDPAAMISVMEILKREQAQYGDIHPYASSHPLADDRIRSLEAKVKRSKTAGVPPDPELNYRYQRARIKLSAFLDSPQQTLGRIGDDPQSELEELAVAIASHRNAELDNALAAADKLIARHPEDPYYHELKGQILFESGAVEESVAPYREAVRLAPHEPLIASGLGQALLSEGSGEANSEALKVLEQAVKDDELDASSRRLLALAYARGGQEDQAALMTAEERLILGDTSSAARFAKRAIAMTQKQSPVWYRARDILAALGAGGE